MANATIRIEGLDRLQKVFEKAPQETVRQLKLALKVSLLEVKKNANDNAFRFKTPRSERSGFLALKFGEGQLNKVTGLKAKIGPTVNYALFVHEGTSRGTRSNQFMPRIAKNSEKGVNGHFKDAIDNVVKFLAR